MKVAIFSRPGPCFPNIISGGLVNMLDELGVENRIFYEGLPMLMRLLPLGKKPKRWHNNLQFRIRNKLSNLMADRKLIKELNEYDAIIISECYPNAFWKNYFAVEELKNKYKGRIISYTESPLDSAPLNRLKNMDEDDYDERLYDFNLFVTDKIEVKSRLRNNQAVIGVNISEDKMLKPARKHEFIAVLDFAQPGFEHYREKQKRILGKLGIKTVELEGRYTLTEIRKIYGQASAFFLAFPETFGLPIAECLASGTYVFSPDSSWPMSWRLDEDPVSMAPGDLPDCFRVYHDEEELEDMLKRLLENHHLRETPFEIFDNFLKYYSRFYYGDKIALQKILGAANG